MALTQIAMRPPYSWTLRHPNGYGRTPRERLITDLAKVVNTHSLENEHDASDVELATYLVACLEARQASLGARMKEPPHARQEIESV